MSGPIIRKYGFPNHENIFGNRDKSHGKDEENAPPGADSASLPPDLPTIEGVSDPTSPESAGKIAPSTEFGSAVE